MFNEVDNLFQSLQLTYVYCCHVSDASVLTEMRMADLIEMKSYTKLIAKQSKQLETLRRKHEKVSRQHHLYLFLLALWCHVR